VRARTPRRRVESKREMDTAVCPDRETWFGIRWRRVCG
jgi:hypothetical protein